MLFGMGADLILFQHINTTRLIFLLQSSQCNKLISIEYNVPSMINLFNIPVNQTQFVDPPFLLDFHLSFSFSPCSQIHYHYAGVEVTGFSRPEYPGHHRVGPEAIGEVLGEVCMAILRCSDDPILLQGDVPELLNVVDDNDVGIEVNDAIYIRVEDIAEIVSGIVQRVLECDPDRRRDQIYDCVFTEDIHLEVKRRESRSDKSGQIPWTRRVELRRDEMEKHVFRTRSVTEDGVYGGY